MNWFSRKGTPYIIFAQSCPFEAVWQVKRRHWCDLCNVGTVCRRVAKNLVSLFFIHTYIICTIVWCTYAFCILNSAALSIRAYWSVYMALLHNVTRRDGRYSSGMKKIKKDCWTHLNNESTYYYIHIYRLYYKGKESPRVLKNINIIIIFLHISIFANITF